jgi:MFS family permease
VILLAAIFSMSVFTVAFQSVPIIMPQLITEFSISTVQASFLMSVAVFPGVFLSLPSGWLCNKYHVKKVGIVASVLMAMACILTAISASYQVMMLGRLILGVGGNLMLITCFSMISQWFGGSGLGKAMGLFTASTPLTTIATYSAVSLALANFNWRFPFYICLILAIIAIALFLVFVRDCPNFKAKEVEVNNKKDLFNTELWKIGLVLLCIEAATGAFSTWAPTLFTQFANMSLVESSLLNSLSVLPTIFLLPFFGYLSDRTSKRRLFIILGPLLMATAFISLASSSYLTTIMIMSLTFFMGAASTLVLPVLRVMPQELLGHGKTGIGFGILSICGALSSVLSSIFIGSLVGIADSLIIPLLGMSVLSAVAVVIALTLKTK